MDILKHQPKTLALFAAFLTAVTLSAPLAYAEESAATDAVQALTDAITDATSDSSDETPEFSNRKERRAYFEKLRAEDPDKFREVMKAKRERWAEKHPEAAERFKDGKYYRHPGDARGPRGDRWDVNLGPDRGRPGLHHRKHHQDRY